MANTINGSKVVGGGEQITLALATNELDGAAKRLATTLVLSNETVLQMLGVDEIEKCFRYALDTILVADSGVSVGDAAVPTFLSDLSMSLSGRYRGVALKGILNVQRVRPNSYDTFLDVLQALGIPVGRVLRINPESTSKVLLAGKLDINGSDHLVSTEDDISVEELVVRAFLDVDAQEEQKVRRVVGYMDNLYCSVDDLIRNWACSLPVGKRG